jgi:hypothetical protein
MLNPFNPQGDHLIYLLEQGIQVEKTIHEAYQLIGDERKAHRSFISILHGERTLSFIRTSRLRDDPFNEAP